MNVINEMVGRVCVCKTQFHLCAGLCVDSLYHPGSLYDIQPSGNPLLPLNKVKTHNVTHIGWFEV